MPRHLLAIVGATATGKTALAIALAQRFDGEIVNADSRQIYRGMDIGTAKPSAAEQVAARHWLIDVAAPDEPFTLATFLDLANAALDDIWSRGRLPIVAGGTGQYVWALIEGWRVPRVPPDPVLRAELDAIAEAQGRAAVASMLREIDPASADAIDARNVRRVIRAIEVTRATGRPFSEWRTKDQKQGAAVIGLCMERGALHRRIDARVEVMIERGLVGEVEQLVAAGFGCDKPAMSGIGYRQICEHLRGACTLGEAAARMKTETHRLVRMQHTWFRDDDPRIRWLDGGASDLVEQALEIVRGSGGAQGPR
jgi:tRNA dimethylallyltransferase